MGSHLSVSLSPRQARLSAPFSHLAATCHGVVLHAHVRVKSRLRPPSRFRSAQSLSDAALASPRTPAPTPRSEASPASPPFQPPCPSAASLSRSEATRHRCSKLTSLPPGRALPPPIAAVFAHELVRTTLLHAGEASAMSPSTALFGHTTELPAQRRRRCPRSLAQGPRARYTGRGQAGPSCGPCAHYVAGL
jgi:hypothetical protein